jgi:YbgC/YbaW family acyl-CoA thioester hydrolase
MAQFVYQHRVQFSETDMAGIVHFANFFRWMEEAEHEYFRTLGLRIVEPLTDGTTLGWPRVSASCNYQSPVRYDALVEVRLDVERLGGRSITYIIEFWDGEVRLASGRMKSACCVCHPDGSLTSVDIPERFLAQIRESPNLPPAE